MEPSDSLSEQEDHWDQIDCRRLLGFYAHLHDCTDQRFERQASCDS